MENALLLLIFFGYTFFIGFLIHQYLINRSKTYHLEKANKTAVRWEMQSKPVFGGITFFSLFIFGLINYLFLFESSFLSSSASMAIILVITISFLMGLADDLLNTPPLFKFGMQLAAAVILIYSGIYIQLFNDATLNYLLTIIWVVGIMNSINMLDNIDAVTTSSGFIILLFTGIMVVLSGHANMCYFLTLLISIYAALGSFLIFNWHPSKMYMGDNGSQFLGAVLAIFSIIFIWNQNIQVTEWQAVYKLVTIALVFTMPLSDTFTVSINRILKGKSPFVGGKDHTTHHLSYAGLTDRQVALVFIAGSIISMALAFILITFYPDAEIKTLLLFMIWPVLMFSSLYALTRIVKPNK